MRKENLKKQILVHLSLFSHGGGRSRSVVIGILWDAR